MTTERHIDNLERADLVETLATHRAFLRHTVQGLTDEQARRRTTASDLCLGGVIKHVASVEEGWVDFIMKGPDAIGPADEAAAEAHAAGFHMSEGETLAGVLARYEDVARRTDDVVASLASFDASHPLPEAPWFEPGGRVVGPAGAPAHHRRDGTTRRPRRHRQGVPRRRQDDGIAVSPISTARLSQVGHDHAPSVDGVGDRS